MKDIINDIRKDINEAFENKNPQPKIDNHKVSPIPERLKKNKKIAIITDNKVEETEFFYPYYRFSEEGYEVDVITPKGGAFIGKHEMGLQESKSIDEVNYKDYELLYLPGGKAPQELRKNEKVLRFVRDFAASGKVIAAICHGPQILISAGLLKGKKIAAWPGIKDEIREAGALFVDEPSQEDGQFVTARKPGDLPQHLYDALQLLAE